MMLIASCWVMMRQELAEKTCNLVEALNETGKDTSESNDSDDDFSKADLQVILTEIEHKVSIEIDKTADEDETAVKMLDILTVILHCETQYDDVPGIHDSVARSRNLLNINVETGCDTETSDNGNRIAISSDSLEVAEHTIIMETMSTHLKGN